MKGKLITIEGLDGAGKSTQIALLTQKLTQLGHRYQFIHFPMLNQGVYGHLIAEFLRGEFGSLDEVHPKLVALLFAEDRNEHKSKINQWLADGYVVILDRYVKSNIAFQCAKLKNEKAKADLKNWILDFEFNYNQLPRPQLSFFLDLPLSVIRSSLSQARTGEDRSYLNGKTDIHEESMELQVNVLQEYKSLLKEYNNFYEIPCASPSGWLSPEDIHRQIYDKLKDIL